VSNLNYLFAAFLITWIVISAYLWMLGRQVQNLKDEVDSLTEGSELSPDRPTGTTSLPDADGHPIRQH
jgi:CcmD family protein